MQLLQVSNNRIPDASKFIVIEPKREIKFAILRKTDCSDLIGGNDMVNAIKNEKKVKVNKMNDKMYLSPLNQREGLLLLINKSTI